MLAGFGDSVTVSAGIGLLLRAKQGANLRPVYLKSLGYYLSRFAQGRESRPLESITTAEVETFLAQFPLAASRATWLNRINTLFSFAVRRSFIARNPCAALERITIERKAPFILSPAQARQLLALAPTVMRPYVVLGLFAGIRPSELLRLTWADVCLETRTVRVNEAKTRRRRIVPLHDKAVALLADFPLRSGPVSPSNSTVRRFKRRACEALGWPAWPSDLLRHTAASYLLALHGDAGKVATMLGNSSGVLLTHYHEPVRNGDCGEFWAG
jgi:integrase